MSSESPPSADFELLETLLLEGGRYALRQRHIARLLASAGALGFAANPASIAAMLDALAAALPGGPWRVRLCLARGGQLRVEHAPLAPLPPGPLPVALAHTPVPRRDPLLAHKTTSRALYDAQRAAHPAAFDVLLWNTDGWLTEFTIGNLVLELGGRALTPECDGGLLPGTMRAELIERGLLTPAPLPIAALARASRLWLINSLRGWVEVVLGQQPGVRSQESE